MMISTKRVAALAVAATFAFGACSSGGAATTAPSAAPEARRRPRVKARRRAGRGAGGLRLDQRVRLLDRRADLDRRRRGLRSRRTPTSSSRSRAPAPATASRCSAPARPTSATPRARSRTKRPQPCKAAGIEYIELAIAYDGMTVMTNPANTAVTCLSFADLYALIGPESTGLQEVVGCAGAGQGARLEHRRSRMRDLTITGPGEESGTYDSFVEIALDKIAGPARQDRSGDQAHATRPDYTASANDNTIIEGIAGSPTLARMGRLRVRRGEQGQGRRDPGLEGPERHVRRAERRDDRRRLVSALANPVHLRQQGEGRGQPGRRGLRRLLPRGGHHLDRARDRALREPAGRQAGGSRADHLGREQSSPPPPPPEPVGPASDGPDRFRPIDNGRAWTSADDGRHDRDTPSRRQRRSAAATRASSGPSSSRPPRLSIAISVGIVLSLVFEAVNFLTSIDLSQLFDRRLVPAARHVRRPDGPRRYLDRDVDRDALAAPVGLASAIYLSEYASPRIRKSSSRSSRSWPASRASSWGSSR